MRKRYGDVVLQNIVSYAVQYNITSFDTIFVGGGTPLTMGAEWFLSLRDTLERNHLITSLQEWTVELNPENISRDTLTILADAGVNRLSVGVQSLDTIVLSQMGRKYDLNILQERLVEARSMTKNLSVDLIYGMELPRSIERELQTLFQTITPNHLSCYSYSLPSKTTHLKQSSEESIAQEEQVLSHLLSEKGYDRYEISNWALPQRESLHNLGYWKSETYLGIGAAAHSFIPKTSLRLHWNNDIALFISGAKPIEEKLTRKEEMQDFLVMGLRLSEGISLKRFENRFNASFADTFGETFVRFCDENLMEINSSTVKVTEKGMYLLNDILLKLF